MPARKKPQRRRRVLLPSPRRRRLHDTIAITAATAVPVVAGHELWAAVHTRQAATDTGPAGAAAIVAVTLSGYVIITIARKARGRRDAAQHPHLPATANQRHHPPSDTGPASCSCRACTPTLPGEPACPNCHERDCPHAHAHTHPCPATTPQPPSP